MTIASILGILLLLGAIIGIVVFIAVIVAAVILIINLSKNKKDSVPEEENTKQLNE